MEGKRTRVFKDDILIAITGANVGKVALVDHDIDEAYVSQSVALVRLKDKQLGKFLHYQLIQTCMETRLILNPWHTALDDPCSIWTILRDVPIRLAPLDQQKCIVAEIEKQFSRLDEAVANLNRVKANLKRYKAAVLKAAVEGKLTEEWRKAHPDVEPASELLKRILAERRAKWEKAELAKRRAAGKPSKDQQWKTKYKELRVNVTELPSLPGEWEWVTWETVLAFGKDSFKRGPFGSALTKSIFVESGYKVYEQYCPINDDCSFARYFVTEEKFKEMESFAVRARDFLISCSGVTLGRITQVPDDFAQGIINQALLRVRLNKELIDDAFFKILFRSPYFQKQIFDNATGSAIPNVKGVNELKVIPLPLPPLQEQKEIVQEIERRMSVVKVMEEQLDATLLRTERLRQTLLTKAFSGKLLRDDTARTGVDSERFGPAVINEETYG